MSDDSSRLIFYVRETDVVFLDLQFFFIIYIIVKIN